MGKSDIRAMPFIRKFLEEFNEFPNGHIFEEEKYFPQLIRGICNFLEINGYVKYGGNLRWEKMEDLPSIEEIFNLIDSFIKEYSITTYRNKRIIRDLLGS